MPDDGFGPDQAGTYCFDFAPPPDNTYWFGHWAETKVDSDDSFFLTTPVTNFESQFSAVAHFDANGALVDGYADHGIATLPDCVATGLVRVLPDHGTLSIGLSGSVVNLGVGAAHVDASGNGDGGYGASGCASADQQAGASIGVQHASVDPGLRLLVSSFSWLPGSGWSDYRLARFTSSGAVDATFNDNGQQAGAPGVAVLTLSSNPEYDEIRGAEALPDGHILVVGQNAKVSEQDGTFNISLLRLQDDAAWDPSFGDAGHAGWSSLNVGGKNDSGARPYSLTVDPRDGRILVGIGTTDANDNGCIGLLRIVADRLFDTGFDSPPPPPACPP